MRNDQQINLKKQGKSINQNSLMAFESLIDDAVRNTYISLLIWAYISVFVIINNIIILFLTAIMSLEYVFSQKDEQLPIVGEIDSRFSIDDDVQQNLMVMRSNEQKIRINTKRKNDKDYYWNDTENRRYVRFLVKNRHLFDLSKDQRKKIRINVLISKSIKTRTSTQCQTHHQKMLSKYLHIEQIIEAHSQFLVQAKIETARTHVIIREKMEEAQAQAERPCIVSPAVSMTTTTNLGDFEDSQQGWMKCVQGFMFEDSQKQQTYIILIYTIENIKLALYLYDIVDTC